MLLWQLNHEKNYFTNPLVLFNFIVGSKILIIARIRSRREKISFARLLQIRSSSRENTSLRYKLSSHEEYSGQQSLSKNKRR